MEHDLKKSVFGNSPRAPLTYFNDGGGGGDPTEVKIL